MSGLHNRDTYYGLKQMDYEIFRKQYKESLLSQVGFVTLPLSDALMIASEVQAEIKAEASMHQTFDDYWHSI